MSVLVCILNAFFVIMILRVIGVGNSRNKPRRKKDVK